MRHRGHLSTKERQRRSRLAKLLHDRRFLCGSLVTMARTCGNPRCKCMRGQKHVSLYLSIKDGQKRKMIYVPPRWEQTIGAWVGVYQQIKQMTHEVSQQCLQHFLAGKQSDRP
jgi:hypothetical protein